MKVKKAHTHCFLLGHSLSEWREAIENNADIKQFKKGQVIFREGEDASGFYFLHSGKVKVHKKWGDNKELIIKFAKESDVLGHRGIGIYQNYPVSATALEPTEACFISPEFLRTTIKVNSDLAYHLMLYYANELHEAELNMRNLVHMDVKSRIANALLKIADAFGINDSGYIQSNLTRQDISSYAGTTYETLFKTMNELIKQQIIESTGKEIRIKNIPALKALVRNN